jgi:hypothetical protein
VLTVNADRDAGEVTAEAMDGGTLLARHYASEAIRLFQASVADPHLQMAQRTLAWLRGRRSLFCLADLYQFGPSTIRDKATATRIVGLLADHGYVERVTGGAEIDGKCRRDVWRLVSEE